MSYRILNVFVLFFIGLAGVLLFIPKAEAARCGGLNQRACKASPARYMGKPGRCARGQFYDIKTRACWSCPRGYNRTIFRIRGKKACQKKGAIVGKWFKARYHGATGCRRPSFFDPRRGGECWACPSGYNRTVWPVTGRGACKPRNPCASGLKKKRGFCVKQRQRQGGKLLNIANRDRKRIERLVIELAKSLSPYRHVQNVRFLRDLIKSKNANAIQRAVYRQPRLRLALDALRVAGFKTMTVGVASSLSVGVGGALETGVSLDTAKRRRPYIFQTRGYSAGLSLQAGNNVVISGYLDPNDRIGNRPTRYLQKWKPSQGFVSSIDGFVAGVGVALWYDYNNRFSGFSVSYSMGSVGAQIWEYNRVETMIQ